MRLRVVPVELDEANALVERWHRHHVPTVSHRWSIGLVDDAGVLHGAAIVGRPVARLVPQRRVAEVARLVTDGSKNGCSMLYAAAARAAQAIGFEKIQTYILDDEPGTSLRAAGWEYEGDTATGLASWSHGARTGARRTDQPERPKGRWAKVLNPPQPEIRSVAIDDGSIALWTADG